jgi:hypothetical protein
MAFEPGHGSLDLWLAANRLRGVSGGLDALWRIGPRISAGASASLERQWGGQALDWRVLAALKGEF